MFRLGLVLLLLLLLLAGAPSGSQAQRNIREIENIADQGAHYVWRRKSDLPFALSDFGIASDQATGTAYLSGGCSVVVDLETEECRTTSAFLRYDADSDTYTPLANFSVPRLRHSTVLLGDSIYLLGGRNGAEDLLPKTEIYTISSNTWRTLAADTANVPYSDGCAFALNNRVYYVGGFDGNYNVSDSAQYLDLATNSWIPVQAKMNKKRGDCFAARMPRENKVYIAGGWEEGFEVPHDSIEVFDGTSFVMQQAKLVPGRGDAAVCPIHSKLFFFGGEDIAREPRDEVQMLSNGVMSYAGELPTKRRRQQCAALTPSSIHVFAGQDASSDDMSERVDEFRMVRIFEDLEARLPTPLRIVGTANAQRWMITLGSLLETRARAPVRVSYRALDSLRAQTEFLGTAANDNEPTDDVYVSDLPLVPEKYAELERQGHVVVQIPVALNPLGVYINLPLDGSSDRIVLTACQLARVFSVVGGAKRRKWSEFTQDKRFANVDVIPLRQGDDTSMTYAMKAYLARECPVEYDADQFMAVPTSPTRTPPNTVLGQVTFTYQSHLLRTGADTYHEAYLRNKQGRELRIDESTVDVYAPPAGDLLKQDMSKVGIVRDDQPRSWPVSAVTFVLLRADQTGTAQTGQLVVSFLNSLFAAQDQAVQQQLGLRPLTSQWNIKSLAAVNGALQLASGSTPYEVHLPADSSAESTYSFAMTRRDRVDIDLTELNGQVSTLQGSVQSLRAQAVTVVPADAAFGIAVAGLVFGLLAFVLAVYAVCVARRVVRIMQQQQHHQQESVGGGRKADSVMNV